MIFRKTFLSFLLSAMIFTSCQPGTVDSQNLKRSVEAEGKDLEKSSPVKLAPAIKKAYVFPEKAIFVSLTGNDENSGENGAPLKNLEEALRRCQGGETIFLRGGNYRINLKLNRYGRDLKQAVEIRNYPNEEVVFDGTEKITQKWSSWKKGIYRAQLDRECWQLFSDNELVYVARWPDASFEDGSIWRMAQSMKSIDGGFRKGKFNGRSRLGMVYDKMFAANTNKGFHEGDSRYEEGTQPGSLADSGMDISGQVAVLNIGHWLTWTRPVLKHQAGSDNFRYSTQGIHQNDLKAYGAYYVLGLKALDRANEWWFDKDKKVIYYMPPAGKKPSEMNLRIRTQHHALDLQKSTKLKFTGINFFATGVNVSECKDMNFEDCRFDYPSTNQFILGKYDWFKLRNQGTATQALSFNGGSGTKLINCEFRRSNAPVFLVDENMLVDNCLFEDIEWDLNSNGGSGSVILGKDSVITRCTVRRGGNSEGIRPAEPGCTIQLNDLEDMGNLQHDGAAINIGTSKQKGVLVEKNWVHDSNRQGVRFDYHGTRVLQKDGSVYGDGIYRNNVTWNTQANQAKGDRHLILNNTVVNINRYKNPEEEEFNMSIQGFRAMHEIEGNGNSVIRNNIANITHRSWQLNIGKKKFTIRPDGYKAPHAYVIPGVEDHNMKERGAAYKYLRDPQNRDFRPKENSPLVDGGALVKPAEIKSKFINYHAQTYLGDAPDIGAYEFGDKEYWIPGRKGEQSSMPVPVNKAVAVPLDAELMFLGAYKAEKHYIYFGESADSLALSAEIVSGNIFQPGKLEAGKQYFWRVDGYRDGQFSTGEIWSFTTKK
ncbi:right-handed parallel beta-helix repeat-containing protein [Lentisphaera profundi]|uniref:Right-handed parallel beta-helix repeat-containing protein n=1 Tax=Lentisphaera profundi TaxID=1658616 RepID=A0ABY7VQN5_9BACT|nr:right-handed parallel beta-helix repeat-containing protein [Lentisphaera profundi]WDE96513.1 right-handed parallel beta-helix repeat-containing protein [Lentisphaera profundi]